MNEEVKSVMKKISSARQEIAPSTLGPGAIFEAQLLLRPDLIVGEAVKVIRIDGASTIVMYKPISGDDSAIVYSDSFGLHGMDTSWVTKITKPSKKAAVFSNMSLAGGMFSNGRFKKHKNQYSDSSPFLLVRHVLNLIGVYGAIRVEKLVESAMKANVIKMVPFYDGEAYYYVAGKKKLKNFIKQRARQFLISQIEIERQFEEYLMTGLSSYHNFDIEEEPLWEEDGEEVSGI